MAWDYTTGSGSTYLPDPVDYSVGPQTDGTNILSGNAATIPQPADTAGGQPAQYGQAVLDIFKFGIGAYSATVQQKNLLDYKRYEATSGGLYRQGVPGSMPAQAVAGNSNFLMMLAVGLVAVVLLTHKG